jgi:hypothetical protein
MSRHFSEVMARGEAIQGGKTKVAG